MRSSAIILSKISVFSWIPLKTLEPGPMAKDARRKMQDARHRAQDARRKTQDARRKAQGSRGLEKLRINSHKKLRKYSQQSFRIYSQWYQSPPAPFPLPFAPCPLLPAPCSSPLIDSISQISDLRVLDSAFLKGYF